MQITKVTLTDSTIRNLKDANHYEIYYGSPIIILKHLMILGDMVLIKEYFSAFGFSDQSNVFISFLKKDKSINSSNELKDVNNLIEIVDNYIVAIRSDESLS